MKTYAYGFPRLGKNREFKKLVEGFWGNDHTKEELVSGLETIQEENIKRYELQVDTSPDGELTFYDQMLDTAILCGVFSPENIEDYYELCRGKSALEMTKWFNTNYHYLITDFSEHAGVNFKLNLEHFALNFKKGAFPSVIGPFTFLKLSKGIAKEEFKKLFLDLVPVYQELLTKFNNVQIEEPAFVLDLTAEEIALIKEGYSKLSDYESKITLITYYDSIDWLEDFLQLPAKAVGLDFLRGKANLEYISHNGFPEEKTLIAGLVDARNVWKNNIPQSIDKLRCLNSKVADIVISNAAPLFHLPVSLVGEEFLNQNLKNKLSFAEEKLAEINLIAKYFNEKTIPAELSSESYGENIDIKNKVKNLKAADFIKPTALAERRAMHDENFKLPLFPTTTIGSFPQTKEVRKNRLNFKKGKILDLEYKQYICSEIDKLIELQEELGLDVFVHGEFERTDMVEFFAQNLEGIGTTDAGWIISYGTRTYRPPIIFGDISRPKPMTLDEIVYAQSKTKKPVKGMLTGAVTIIAWSFVRQDIPVSDVAYQIGLSLKEEIEDYEKNGISIVQVDEAAFREKAPIKKRDWPEYFEWAVKSFNLTINTDSKTQIHTHMCYSEFSEIIEYINQMDFDVISIEASRSKGDIITFFENIDFKRQVGLGVWDIHSPTVPPVAKMVDIGRRALKKIPKENFWINPDCGLKTRNWDETKEALLNLIETSKELRK
ncbi:MAG: 5-methyltetrahydropteroyltriglutamate--homocysteine S-methyltransferase [bacterium]|nr:5-methyltetrahydropteroyltriglutamate--homocysteine S-methyltransferase [bacterium]